MADGNKCSMCMYLDETREKTEPGFFKNKTYRICKKFGVWRNIEANACDAFVGDHNCFLTSACVRYKGLEDDCRELTALRNFRDNVMSEMEGGAELIKEYYRIGPALVERIDSSENQNEVYSYIYDTITECLVLLDKADHESVKNTYVAMVEKLKADFNI